MKRKALLYVLASIGLGTIGAVAFLAWLLIPKWEQPPNSDGMPPWQS